MKCDHFTQEYKGCAINVFYDECAENPFENWDATGQFYHWKDHGNDQYMRYCELLNYDPDTRELLPDGMPDVDAVRIDKYEHSGISYSIAGEGMQCRWDTSNSWAVWYPDKCLMQELKGLKGDERRAKCIEYARQACTLFNQWANGEVYGYNAEDPSGNLIDSCWGYYGYEAMEEQIEEIKRMIDAHLIEAAKFAPQTIS